MFTKSRSAIVVLILLALTTLSCAATIHYRGRSHAAVRGRIVFVGGYYYDPFFGPYPWWEPVAYSRPYFPIFDERAEVRLLVSPTSAAVYVDGFYAGIVEDFNGFFERLPVPPGGHELVMYENGYRTARQPIYLSPGSTFKIQLKMAPLAPGETSEPPEVAPSVPQPPVGTFNPPRTPPRAW